MKALLVAAVLAVGSVVALHGGSDNNTHAQSDAPVWQQGVDKVDGMLQQGLTRKTHDEIAVKAKASAEWLSGFGASVVSATKDN